MQVAPHQGVHHLAHGDHDPAEQDQALAQLEAAPLDLHVLRNVGEELVLQRLDGVVQALHRLEVAIHDIVEQPVQQAADAGSGQIGAGVPAFHDAPMSSPSSLRTVISARAVTKAASSLVASSPDSASSRAPYTFMNRWLW